MAQTLEDQLFVHHRVDVESLRQFVPKGLEVEEHSGSGWLGVTPFAVSGLRLRGTMSFPLVSSYLELNVRTYVRWDDRPGIYFFSLHASNRLVVEAARRLYRAPAFHARLSSRRGRESIHFEGARGDGKAFSASYRPVGRIAQPETGSLEHFLTERYCLYAETRDELHCAEIHHRPWALQAAEAEIELDTTTPTGIDLREEPLMHFSASQDALLWPLAGVGRRHQGGAADHKAGVSPGSIPRNEQNAGRGGIHR